MLTHEPIDEHCPVCKQVLPKPLAVPRLEPREPDVWQQMTAFFADYGIKLGDKP